MMKSRAMDETGLGSEYKSPGKSNKGSSYSKKSMGVAFDSQTDFGAQSAVKTH
jgi:hypothetical protein